MRPITRIARNVLRFIHINQINPRTLLPLRSHSRARARARARASAPARARAVPSSRPVKSFWRRRMKRFAWNCFIPPSRSSSSVVSKSCSIVRPASSPAYCDRLQLPKNSSSKGRHDAVPVPSSGSGSGLGWHALRAGCLRSARRGDDQLHRSLDVSSARREHRARLLLREAQRRQPA